MYQNPRLPFILPVLFFLFLVAIIPGFQGAWIDVHYWQNWANYIHDQGLRHAYGSTTNYPPVYQYILWAFAKLAGSKEAIDHNIGYLRIFTLLAEYWGLWLVYRWIDKRVDYVFLLLCSMFNIAYIYDTMMWGQVDAILSALVIASLYHLYYERRLASAIFMVLALNMKLQAIVFVPLWGLLMIASLHRSRRWKESFPIIAAILVTQAVLLIPFAFGRGGIGAVWKAVAGLVDAYPWISLNAYNMWYLLVAEAGPGNIDSVRSLFGLTYYHIGLISFSIALFVALFPVLKYTFSTLYNRNVSAIQREKIWLSGALCALVFFYFNTRMHERYAHPAFIFLTAYAFYTGKFGLLLLFSLAFFLDMEKVLEWLKLKNYEMMLFDPQFTSLIFAGCIVWTTVLLYKKSVNTSSVKTEGTRPAHNIGAMN